MFLYETCGVGKAWCLIHGVVYARKPLVNASVIKVYKPGNNLFLKGAGYVMEVRVYNGAGFLWRELTTAILVDDTPPTTGEVPIVNEASRQPIDVHWTNTEAYVDLDLQLGCYNWTDALGNPAGQLGFPVEVLTNAEGATPLLGDWVDLDSAVAQRYVQLYQVAQDGVRTLIRNSSFESLQAQCVPSDDVINFDSYMRAVPLAFGVNASAANATCLALSTVRANWTLCEPFEALYGRWSIGHPTATQGWTSWSSDGTYSGFYLNMEDLPSSTTKPNQDTLYALCCHMPRIFWTIPATFSATQAKLNCNASTAPGELDGNITLINKRLCSDSELPVLLARYGLQPQLALKSKFWIARQTNVGYITMQPAFAGQTPWPSRAAYNGEQTIIPYCCADRAPPSSGLTRLRISQLQLPSKLPSTGVSLVPQGAGSVKAHTLATYADQVYQVDVTISNIVLLQSINSSIRFKVDPIPPRSSTGLQITFPTTYHSQSTVAVGSTTTVDGQYLSAAIPSADNINVTWNVLDWDSGLDTFTLEARLDDSPLVTWASTV